MAALVSTGDAYAVAFARIDIPLWRWHVAYWLRTLTAHILEGVLSSTRIEDPCTLADRIVKHRCFPLR